VPLRNYSLTHPYVSQEYGGYYVLLMHLFLFFFVTYCELIRKKLNNLLLCFLQLSVRKTLNALCRLQFR